MILVQPAQLDDSSTLSALHRAAFPPGEGWSSAAFADVLGLPTSFALKGINDAGTLSALAIFQIVPPEAELLTLAVDPATQGRGFARQLLQQAFNALTGQGVIRIQLEVAADNAPAQHLYHAMGFTQDGIRTAYYQRQHSDPVDALLLSYILGGQS